MSGNRVPTFLLLVLMPPLLAVAEPADSSPAPPATDKRPAPAAPAEVRLGALPNPVLDERCAVNRNAAGQDPDENGRLPGVFAVHFPDRGLSYCWDPVECRLLYIWRNGFLKGGSAIDGDLAYVAEGPAPLAASVGAFDAPNFFGYRMVDGAPEFLYTQGLLSVVERITPADDGKSLAQHFSVQNTPFEVTLSIPERWKEQVRPSQGDWENGFVTIPRKSIADFRLTYNLEKTPELPELRKDWNPAPASPVVMAPSQPEKAAPEKPEADANPSPPAKPAPEETPQP